MDFMISDTAVFGGRKKRDQEPELHIHPQVAAAMVGSAVVGGAIASKGAKSAANTQAAAADRATASQQAMFDQTVRNNAPYNSAGQAATAKLSDLLGLPAQQPSGGSNGGGGFDAQAYLRDNPDVAASAYWSQRPEEHYLQHGKAEGRAMPTLGATVAPIAPSADTGSLLKPFSMEDFHLDPGIQFQTQQGNLALTNSAAAKNGVLSGGALKDFIAYNQGMAGTGYQSAFDRYMAGKKFTLGSLMDVSQLGQTAASNGSTGGSSYANGIAGTITGAGNALAAGQVGSANAISGGLGGAANGYMLSRFLSPSSTDIGGPITTSANPGGVYIAPNA